MKMKRVFSGVKPSSNLSRQLPRGHRHFVAMQDDYDCYYSVVNLHALTVPQDPEALRQQAISLAALIL